MLSQTGLYSNIANDEIAIGVEAFQPRFELWSDGASKRRWIWLPPGMTIDVSAPNDWSFPEGTKFWKEFTRDGVRAETRLVEKVVNDWLAVAYLWTDDGSDAVAQTNGVIDARGTPHDVPRPADCRGCLGGRGSFVLGFSAVQLGVAGDAGHLTLARLKQPGRVAGDVPAVVDVPGDDVERRALGYLHANCSHCHNQRRPPEPIEARCFNPRRVFDFSLRVGELDNVESTAVYRTAIGRVIVPGHPESSTVYKRAHGEAAFHPRMPPLGTEERDPTILPLLEEWIRGIDQSATGARTSY